jgi:hypothetical protein
MFWIYRRAIERNAVGNDMDIDQPNAGVEIVREASGVFQSGPSELRGSVGDDDLEIGSGRPDKVRCYFALTPRFRVIHIGEPIRKRAKKLLRRY